MKLITYIMVVEQTNTGHKMLEKEKYMVEDNVTAKEKAQSIINYFNKTLRPFESPRKLLGVVKVREYFNGELPEEKSDTGRLDHDWRKINLVTTKEGCDILQCSICGIEAKRFALGHDPSIARYKRHQKYIYNCPGKKIK